MMTMIKKFILNNRILSSVVLFFYTFVKQIKLYSSTQKKLKAAKNSKNKIFYIGIPVHSNLGDLAQGICIRKWLKKHYPEREVVEIETNSLVNTRFSALNHLKEAFADGDFIVFQSGYTTTDLGGWADEMHRAVMDILPDAPMLMLPQTIFFEKEENKQRSAEVYNRTRKLLFLARDKISYNTALEMFPDIGVKLFPDIVTTMIGKLSFDNRRAGVLFCCRNDSEKYYSDLQIESLMSKLSDISDVKKTDTTKTFNSSRDVANAEDLIMQEIEEYSKYKAIITDRYHGTIFSLVANTPIVVLKTTDHKVTTGLDWFVGKYDEHIYLAENLDDAYEKVKNILAAGTEEKLYNFSEKEYYDLLPEIFGNYIKEANI